MKSARPFFARSCPSLPALALALAALLAGCQPATPADTDAAALAARARPLDWPALIPGGWDPTRRYRDLNLADLRDNDPKAVQMLEDLRAVWDNAPVDTALDGQAVRLAGFVVPLEATPEALSEFLLVPYFGACIHSPPPPANQLVRVILAHPAPGLHAMDVVEASGRMETERHVSAEMGTSGYTMRLASAAKRPAPSP